MNREHWNRLKRGDLVQNKEGGFVLQIVQVGDEENGVRQHIVISSPGIVWDHENWNEVNDDRRIVRDDGTVDPDVGAYPIPFKYPDPCKLCNGRKVVNAENDICYRCEGTGIDPNLLNESKISVVCFYPRSVEKKQPVVILSVDSKVLNPAQVLYALQTAVQIMKTSIATGGADEVSKAQQPAVRGSSLDLAGMKVSSKFKQ